jgi:hypothetical protein
MSTTISDTVEFKQQLHDSEAHMAQLARDYPDLPPDQQRECMGRLDQTMKLLFQTRSDLLAAEKRSAGVNVVQVMGLENSIASGRILDLETSFQQYQTSQINRGFGRGSEPVLLPDGFPVATEHNHIVAASGHLKPLTEYFLHFAKHEDVYRVLDLKPIHMPLVYGQGCTGGASIQFVRPARDAATRALWRSIGEHIERVKAVDAEFVKMKVNRDDYNGCPGLPKDVIDRSFFLDPKKLPLWESTREVGGSLDHHAFAVLRNFTPINTAALQARITALYNEQCDALIQLRKHQLAGLEFIF